LTVFEVIHALLEVGDAMPQVVDLSVAFDTIDHAILLEKLHEKVGSKETALH
jgi:hypothetical protein